MGADADGLVTDLLEAFLHLRREVSTLPPEQRDEGQAQGASALDDVIRRSPVDDLRARLLERARIAEGEALASWIDELLAP